MTKRMNLEISQSFDDTLETLKGKMGKTSKAEVIRSAITLLNYVKQQEENGGQLAISKDGEVDKEIIVS